MSYGPADRSENKPMGERRAACVRLIREAGAEGIMGSDIVRIMDDLGYHNVSVCSCLMSDDLIYEEEEKKHHIRYFWAGA